MAASTRRLGEVKNTRAQDATVREEYCEMYSLMLITFSPRPSSPLEKRNSSYPTGLGMALSLLIKLLQNLMSDASVSPWGVGPV